MKKNIKQFIYDNIKPYNKNGNFLCKPTKKTQKLRKEVQKLLKEETENGGILKIDNETIAGINSHKPGYINKKLEVIVGLQTDEPLKRAIKPFGGRRVAKKACEENGIEMSPKVLEIFSKYRKTHNDGVFDVYTDNMLKYRKVGILSGLPDNYARGRIIGDYRKLAYYGINELIKQKEKDKKQLTGEMTNKLIKLREEVSEQIKALKEIKEMAKSYGFDISKPAKNAQEAIQWTYFAFLAGIKEQDGAAMSLGNVSSFFDIYIEKDLKKGILKEETAQELIDQFVIKLRIIRQLRMDAYNEIFAGDPTWTTESIGGSFKDGKHKITKTSYRFLQTLYNLGPAPEPNLTILRSKNLPHNFKKFCAQVSIETSSIQYENDDLMKKCGNCDDYSIACCVSQMETGKEMQFFGARCNLAKALLYSINGGFDEIYEEKVIDGFDPIKTEFLEYKTVKRQFRKMIEKLCESYTNTMNIIHYMHDKYYYEKAQMAFMDSIVKRNMAFGIAGLSVVVDSLSAIKYAKVKPKYNKKGIAKDFEIIGDFPKFGNDNPQVDKIAKEVTHKFISELKKHHIYREATPTLSILTITANVAYGKKTGTTPDGRKKGEPFAPGANPMHGRDNNGAIASLNSVASISYKDCKDGISNTFSLIPSTLGATENEKTENLVNLLNGYFENNAQHLNVNILKPEVLKDAMKNPEKYPQLTIRVSGYAVNFIKLSKEQQKEVISRTFHKSM